jgi:hypothetical protein
MKKLVCFALTAFIFAGIASAQNLPPIDVFGGYSYFNFGEPSSTETPSEQLNLQGWNASASINVFRHIGVEVDFSGHQAANCAGVANVTCSNFAYLFGPRYTFGDRSSKSTFFIHAMVGQDRATVLGLNGTTPADNTLNDTSAALAVGAGADFWVLRHIGIQLGPVDLVHTNHFSDSGASSQNTLRASAGIAFRFGGDFPVEEPKAPKEPKAKPEPQPESESESNHHWWKPWHRSHPAPTEGQPTTAAGPKPGAPTHGLSIHSLGLVATPQEFDGARIAQIEPGSVAEMASLHVGDLITSVDGKAVKTPMELAAELSDKTGKVRIGIQRGKLSTETVIIISAQ